ncbi:MAG: hypothetical protein LBP81_07620 [Treponema sp.]|jgi:hypothetical protein|nr:hypothetical protein [Treponema sp.]
MGTWCLPLHGIPGTAITIYNGEFYNYPSGRVDPNGRLEIRNTVNSSTLLFNGTLEGGNYIGTIEPLSSVQVKLPEEKFYTILAVDKEE